MLHQVHLHSRYTTNIDNTICSSRMKTYAMSLWTCPMLYFHLLTLSKVFQAHNWTDKSLDLHFIIFNFYKKRISFPKNRQHSYLTITINLIFSQEWTVNRLHRYRDCHCIWNISKYSNILESSTFQCIFSVKHKTHSTLLSLHDTLIIHAR